MRVVLKKVKRRRRRSVRYTRKPKPYLDRQEHEVLGDILIITKIGSLLLKENKEGVEIKYTNLTSDIVAVHRYVKTKELIDGN